MSDQENRAREPAESDSRKTKKTAAENIFAVGSENISQALHLGLYPALAHMVLSRGTGGDQRTTRWRAESIRKRTGIRWKKARAAIDELADAELVEILDCDSRQAPPLRLAEPAGDPIWLPNALVDGINCSRPMALIRETQSTAVLELLLNFYRYQNLADCHGIDRDWLWQEGEVEPHWRIRPFQPLGGLYEQYSKNVQTDSHYGGIRLRFRTILENPRNFGTPWIRRMVLVRR